MTAMRTETCHATAVAVGHRAVLLTGASGSGKSGLALEMMARGAALVADDQVILTRDDDAITLTCPPPLRGMIEARGVGILHAEPCAEAQLALVVDMDQTETDRMPPARMIDMLGVSIKLLHNVASQHFPAAIIQYLKTADR